MRILQLGKFYPIRGGVEKVMYDLTLGVSAAGFRCDMLCASTEDYPPGEIRLNPLAKVIVVDTKIKLAATMLAPDMIFKLREIVRHYDIIHVHHPDPMAALALFLSRFKGKVLVHWHSDIVKQKVLLQAYRPLQSWLIRRADKIVGTTPIYVSQSDFLQHVQTKTDYIPIGVVPIQADDTLVKQIKASYLGKRIIFSLGRLVAYKGYEYLIKALRYMPQDIHLIIAGQGPLLKELEDLAAYVGVKDQVTFVGFVEDPIAHAYFAACEIFCLSSTMKTEAFAIVQIEAMSCGKPVISTRIEGSGVSWVNVHGRSGLTVPVADEKAIADAVCHVLEDSSFYKRLSDGARSRYAEHFTLDRMVAKCLEVYKNL